MACFEISEKGNKRERKRACLASPAVIWRTEASASVLATALRRLASVSERRAGNAPVKKRVTRAGPLRPRPTIYSNGWWVVLRVSGFTSDSSRLNSRRSLMPASSGSLTEDHSPSSGWKG